MRNTVRIGMLVLLAGAVMAETDLREAPKAHPTFSTDKISEFLRKREYRLTEGKDKASDTFMVGSTVKNCIVVFHGTSSKLREVEICLMGFDMPAPGLQGEELGKELIRTLMLGLNEIAAVAAYLADDDGEDMDLWIRQCFVEATKVNERKTFRRVGGGLIYSIESDNRGLKFEVKVSLP